MEIRKIIWRDIKGIPWRTNRCLRRKSNFHRGGNAGNLGSDIAEIRRIVREIECATRMQALAGILGDGYQKSGR